MLVVTHEPSTDRPIFIFFFVMRIVDSGALVVALIFSSSSLARVECDCTYSLFAEKHRCRNLSIAGWRFFVVWCLL